MKIHVVQKGETLRRISKKYNVDLEKLIAVNPHIKDPEKIAAKMKVKIPTAGVPLKPKGSAAQAAGKNLAKKESLEKKEAFQDGSEQSTNENDHSQHQYPGFNGYSANQDSDMESDSYMPHLHYPQMMPYSMPYGGQYPGMMMSYPMGPYYHSFYPQLTHYQLQLDPYYSPAMYGSSPMNGYPYSFAPSVGMPHLHPMQVMHYYPEMWDPMWDSLEDNRDDIGIMHREADNDADNIDSMTEK